MIHRIHSLACPCVPINVSVQVLPEFLQVGTESVSQKFCSDNRTFCSVRCHVVWRWFIFLFCIFLLLLVKASAVSFGMGFAVVGGIFAEHRHGDEQARLGALVRQSWQERGPGVGLVTVMHRQEPSRVGAVRSGETECRVHAVLRV